nr:hypothetical protein [Tanacetum cinerariifolium]
FPFVYEQKPSYNPNYDGNYYSHDLPSFPCCDYCGGSHENYQCQPIAHNIDFSGSDQIQTPQYPDVQENPLTNDEFEAFIKANDDKINNLETEFDHFQKQCEQMHDDLLNQMRNFIQNFQSGPPGEVKEHEATTDTKLLSTEDIHPLAIQEPPRESDICQLIEECCVEVPEQQKQKMEDTMLDLVKICHHKQFLCIHDDNDVPDNSLNDPLLEEADLFLSKDSIPPGIKNVADDPEGDVRFLEELLID